MVLNSREKAIKDLLSRSASKLDEWMTRGLVGSLKIPMTWLNEAKVCNLITQKYWSLNSRLPPQGNIRTG